MQNWLQAVAHTQLQNLLLVAHVVWGAWNAVIHWPWTAPIAVVVIVTVGLLSISYAHHRWKRGWLSQLVGQRLSTMRKQRPHRKRAFPKQWRRVASVFGLFLLERWDDLLGYFRTKFIPDLRALYFPSLFSFVILAAVFAAFFLGPQLPSWPALSNWHDWWQILTTDLADQNPKAEDRIVGAFTGLAVVVIALIVFVAESIRDDKDPERKRVLLQKGLLWPLGVAATIIPFGFLWSASRGLTILLEVIVGAVTLFSFARVIRALLVPEIQASGRLSLLRQRVRGMISDSVRERVANSILIEQLGEGKRIDALHYLISRAWIEDGPQRYAFIDAPQDGWISDIQLDELQKLGERLDRHAREVAGFALRASGPNVGPATTGVDTTPSATKPLPVQKAYLLKRYREEIPPDSIFYGKSRALFALPEPLGRSSEVLADINATVSHIFRFTKEEPSSVSIRREMQGTKDQLAQAIRDNALGEIDELREVYLRIAEDFLTLLVEHGGGYTAEEARKERGNFFASWTEIRWLVSDLRELIIIAADAGNTDALGKIAFLPFAISMRAIQARDHFVFQQFYQFAVFLYVLAIEKEEGSPVRAWMAEKSWRWPKEIADLYIAHELNARASASSDLEQMRDFALFSLRIYQDLLKLMADKRDLTNFTAVAQQLRGLYSRFREADDQPRIDVLRFQIERAQDDEQRTLLTAQLERQQTRQKIVAALDIAIDEIFLALSGRVLAQRLETPDDEPTRKLSDNIFGLLPDTLPKLAAAFAEASDWRASDTWGWSQWDMIADGKARFVDTHTKLNQAFAVRALQLLAALQPDARTAIALPPSATLAEMVREGNTQGLLATLAAIEANPLRWQPILSEEARGCIGSLRQILAAAWTTEQERAAERTRSAPLDPEKVTEFCNEVVRSFNDFGRLRDILAAKGALTTDLSKSPGPPAQSLGINQIDDKNAFITQDHTDYVGWGRGYGQGMANGEDEESFALMIENAKTQRTVPPSAVVAAIGTAITDAKLKDPIVLQTVEFDTRYHEIEEHRDFTPKYHPDFQSPWRDFNGFIGLLAFGTRPVPVFDAFVQRPGSRNKILVVDAKQFLRWRQFAPERDIGEPTYADGQLLIRVSDLNTDKVRRDEIISQNPDWLAQEQDPASYLRGRVLLNVYEKFHIEILDSSQAMCLTVPATADVDQVT